MKRFKEYAIILTVGGIYYFLLEILWRGYSHWVMMMVGGASALLLYVINEKLRAVPFVLKCFLGAGIITVAELLSGIVVNLWLGWDVWDYSELRYNLLGQISIKTSLLWLLLCVPAFALSDIVKQIFILKGEGSGKKIKKAES